jgi:hypothetical protein
MEIIDLGELEKTEAGFTTFLKELCDNLELDFANNCAVNTMSNEVIGFTTYTDAWKEYYTEQRFQNIDPTLHLPMRSIAPIDWQRLSGHEGFDKVFENARDFNIKPQGLSIPIHGPYGEIGLISVTRDCNEDTWEKLRRKVLPELQTAAVGLHDTNSGLVWGGEIGLSSAENTPNLSTGALGTTEFNGKFVINPRLRAGFATGNLFLYGTAGVAISDAVVRSAGATTKDYTMGVSYGIGAEMKIGNGWSTRFDLTRTDLGQKNQSFNGLTRDTNVKMDKITIGLTKSF